jgi:hypothetical protein
VAIRTKFLPALLGIAASDLDNEFRELLTQGVKTSGIAIDNSLSAEEFHDNLRLRYNLLPLDMPQLCNGCGAPMTVEHALCCKVGGLVHIRHDDVADEWRHLCGCALSFGHVEREPRIYSSVSRQQRLDASSDAPSGEKTT